MTTKLPLAVAIIFLGIEDLRLAHEGSYLVLGLFSHEHTIMAQLLHRSQGRSFVHGDIGLHFTVVPASTTWPMLSMPAF